ncbi:cytoskeletal protein RodZ [Geomicrobium halophilum]|uniref:Cytoskeletal protein RodZ n=1 Tax=Geomicrobium halophilum TaxID=549000 RepID=A0A841PYI4_9BACL|nr:helix-turn-helix domain-containing protein [Geomicrobium halophilum]MBB6449245.1 cytoskeletal protein RodZ [Geomicrobium halophilum]
MAELGQFLREKREEKGWRIEEVQAHTKIQKRYLLAIEGGRYNELPGAFYARAFIKSYVEVLGLNPEEVFSEFDHDLPKPSKEAIEFPSRVERAKTKRSPESKKSTTVLPAALVISFLVAIVGIIWFLNIGNGDVASDEEEGSPNQEEVEIINEPQESGNNEGDGETEAVNGTEEGQGNNGNHEEDESGGLSYEETTGNYNSIYTVDSASLEIELVFEEGIDSYVDFREEVGGTIIEVADPPAEALEQEYDFSEYDTITINAGYTPSLTIYVNSEELEYAVDPEERDLQNITIEQNG